MTDSLMSYQELRQLLLRSTTQLIP